MIKRFETAVGWARPDLTVYFVELRERLVLFFYKHSTNVDTHTRISTYLYKYTHAHPTHMSTFKRLSRLDIEIHEVGHQEHITVDRNVVSY
jgi:hypothetical protein